MEFLRNNTPPADGGMIVVSGRTLSETFKRVRQEYGPEAVISGSRTNTRRKSSGWGTEQFVEVLVENPAAAGRRPVHDEPARGDVTGEIGREVERLERLVAEITSHRPLPGPGEPELPANPLKEYLTGNGASPAAVDRLLARFSGETGKAVTDRPAAMNWLMGYLETGVSSLADVTGIHAVLVEHPDQRLELVLQMARHLAALGRRILVVSILPDPDRHLPLLKTMAAASGHDAAVVQAAGQLEEIQEHLADYDLVLLDPPALADPALATGGELHQWLSANPEVHRHLQVPLDRDFMDLTDLGTAARLWNCDSVALVRLEGTRRPAKILDLCDAIPLPVSLLADTTTQDGYLAAATADLLLDRILASYANPGFKPGLKIESA